MNQLYRVGSKDRVGSKGREWCFFQQATQIARLEKVQQLFEFEGYPRMGRPNFIFGVQPINRDF